MLKRFGFQGVIRTCRYTFLVSLALLPSSSRGGGIKENIELGLASLPLLWMEMQAKFASLRLQPRGLKSIVSSFDKLSDWQTPTKPSKLWKLLELLPFRRTSEGGSTPFT